MDDCLDLFRSWQEKEGSTPTHSVKNPRCSLESKTQPSSRPLVTLFIRVLRAQMGSFKPQAASDISSLQRGERGERKHLSVEKSSGEGTISTAHLIGSTLPLLRSPTGRHPCLDYITRVPAKSSVLSPITEWDQTAWNWLGNHIDNLFMFSCKKRVHKKEQEGEMKISGRPLQKWELKTV